MREQSSLDFASKVPNAFTRKGTLQSRHASRRGAEDAANRAESQTARYLALLQAYPEGLTDWRAAQLLSMPGREVERTSINARRSPLVKAGVVISNGFVKDEHSEVANTRWQLASFRRNQDSISKVSATPRQVPATDACSSVDARTEEIRAVSSGAPLTSATVKTLAYNTPVRLADGRRALYKMPMKNGDLACVIGAGEPIYLKPEGLIDRRESDGELVEVSE